VVLFCFERFIRRYQGDFRSSSPPIPFPIPRCLPRIGEAPPLEFLLASCFFFFFFFFGTFHSPGTRSQRQICPLLVHFRPHLVCFLSKSSTFAGGTLPVFCPKRARRGLSDGRAPNFSYFSPFSRPSLFSSCLVSCTDVGEVCPIPGTTPPPCPQFPATTIEQWQTVSDPFTPAPPHLF